MVRLSRCVRRAGACGDERHLAVVRTLRRRLHFLTWRESGGGGGTEGEAGGPVMLMMRFVLLHAEHELVDSEQMVTCESFRAGCTWWGLYKVDPLTVCP